MTRQASSNAWSRGSASIAVSRGRPAGRFGHRGQELRLRHVLLGDLEIVDVVLQKERHRHPRLHPRIHRFLERRRLLPQPLAGGSAQRHYDAAFNLRLYDIGIYIPSAIYYSHHFVNMDPA